MSYFYETLKWHDPGIASVYNELTGDKPGALIGKSGKDLILHQCFKDKFISRGEAEALLYLIKEHKFTKDAVLELFADLGVAEQGEVLGTRNPLDTPEKL